MKIGDKFIAREGRRVLDRGMPCTVTDIKRNGTVLALDSDGNDRQFKSYIFSLEGIEK